MILNRKKRRQALLRILACEIIATVEIRDPESIDKITENLADLAYYVGGSRGMRKVLNKFDEYIKEHVSCDSCEVDNEH